MIRAAIYARKSQEQNGVSEEARSVPRQIENAKAYAAAKGWLVDDAHVFADDHISGAEFDKRHGFLRLMNALKPKPPFQALVMMEEARLGREQIETAYALKQIITAGVRLFFYLDNRERTLDSPTEKLLLSVTAFADELEREKARQRTADTMVRKARLGHVTGGRVFGYTNTVEFDGHGERHHVERRINGAEADVIRRIFRRCAEGAGYQVIAHELNAEHAPAPRPRHDRPRGWAPSSVREILYRDLYRGVQVYNRTRKRDQWGKKKPTDRPEAEWIRADVPTCGSSRTRCGRPPTSGSPVRGAPTCARRTASCGANRLTGLSRGFCYLGSRPAGSAAAG